MIESKINQKVGGMMKTGSELDALVAKNVMGWEDPWQPFQPSTDESDAFKVLEKFDVYSVLKAPDGVYEARINIFSPGEDGITTRNFYAEGQTMPLAVCKAALKAVGVDPNGN